MIRLMCIPSMFVDLFGVAMRLYINQSDQNAFIRSHMRVFVGSFLSFFFSNPRCVTREEF